MYNFKKRETLNKTCASTTLNAKKKIVKQRNTYNTKCCERSNNNKIK